MCRGHVPAGLAGPEQMSSGRRSQDRPPPPPRPNPLGPLTQRGAQLSEAHGRAAVFVGWEIRCLGHCEHSQVEPDFLGAGRLVSDFGM